MGTVDIHFSHVINNDGNFETMSVRLEDVLQQGSLSTSLLLCQSLSNESLYETRHARDDRWMGGKIELEGG